MHSTTDVQSIATNELVDYLEQQAALIAPEIPAIVPAPITVERVAFTRNASNVPYIVYRVRGGSRCSRFIKRRHFIEIVQAFLAQVSGVEEWIISIVSTKNWGFAVKRGSALRCGLLCNSSPIRGLVKEFIPYTLINECIQQFNNGRLPVTPELRITNYELRIKKGDRVIWTQCPYAHLESLQPFSVVSVENGKARLDILEILVPVSELELHPVQWEHNNLVA